MLLVTEISSYIKTAFESNPYGDRGDDSFGIDNRALQGYARYIGLRNLIGQIDIQGENAELRETTSRLVVL